MSKNPNRSKLRGIFTPENGYKMPERSSGVLNPFSLNKRAFIFTLDSILAVIIGAIIITASYFLLSHPDPGFNAQALNRISFDSLAVLEKDSTLRNAADTKSPSGLGTFIISMPGNICSNISVFDNSSALITSSQKSNCNLNYSIVTRRAFVSSNSSPYYAEMKISFG